MQSKRSKKKRYRPLFGFCVGLLRLFGKKRKTEGCVPNDSCIFLCRHLDEKGVIASFSGIKTVMRPWVLDVFMQYGTAKKQFKEYTFSVRKKKGKAYCEVMSTLAGWGYSKLMKSARGIPVYRGEKSSQSITTIKKSVRALEDGDNIIIYADVDYADTSDSQTGEIYVGYKLVDKMYYRRNGKHIPFVPVYINDSKIVLHEPLFFDGDDSETIEKIRRKMFNAS